MLILDICVYLNDRVVQNVQNVRNVLLQSFITADYHNIAGSHAVKPHVYEKQTEQD